MSHHRKNSVRDKVIGKKFNYSDLERSTLHRQSVGHRREQVQPWNVAWLVSIGWVISYAKEWEDYSNYFGGKWRFPGFGPPPTPWSFDSAWNCHGTSGSVISLADWGSRSGLVCPSWSHLVLTGLCCVLQFSSFTQLCPALCDPMDCSTPGFPVHHQLPELA